MFHWLLSSAGHKYMPLSKISFITGIELVPSVAFGFRLYRYEHRDSLLLLLLKLL
jgi:hypothetical protein